jgi:HD superfamily phosphohydrolase
MSNYGLDEAQRSCKPWDLPAAVLAPGKVITDPVHGDIYLTKLEVAILDSAPFQRLRRIRQLGNTDLVYPGAVHTRFSHCLGAMKVAQMLLDVIWSQSDGLHGVKDDLFAEWKSPNGARDAGKWARVTVLARLGALLHDLCHVPAGHTVEDDLKILEPHDENEDRFDALWGQLRKDVPNRLAQLKGIDETACQAVDRALLDPDGDLHHELRPLIISKGEATMGIDEMEYPFCADLVGNTICADLLDYLDRDHLFTGLPESLGRRFISAFFVTPSDQGQFSRRLVLSIGRDGHERPDVISELLKALRYRYELSERALVHHAKLAADAMLGESIERWEWALWLAAAKKRGLVPQEKDRARTMYSSDQVAKERATLEENADRKKMSKREWAGHPLGEVEAEVRVAMESEFRRFGDEGLLDFLSHLPSHASEELSRPLLRASARLATDLRDRKLFEIADRVGVPNVDAEETHENFGDPAVRAELEAEAQRFAGLGSEAKVILWIPPPDMRLKLANVLVQHQSEIAQFVKYERNGSRRGSDIYDAHKRLWSAYIFVRRDVTEVQKRMVTAFLARRMDIKWERHRYLGENPDRWPLRLAVSRQFDARFESEVDVILAEHEDALQGVAARMPKTYKALEQRVEKVKSSRESERRMSNR